MNSKSFTIEDGIAVQDDQLKKWKVKLVPELFADLVMYAKETNHIAKNGYDIRRGGDLDTFIFNWKPNNE